MREVFFLWQDLTKLHEEEKRMERRWQLTLTQLMQPVMTKEGARSHQNLFQRLWRALAPREEREFEQEKDKKLIEEVTGVPFVRKGISAREVSKEG